MTKTIVSLHRWPDYRAPQAPLAECLADLGGMAALVHPGQMVVIKPNLTANEAEESGGTTHVALIEALIHEVQRCAPRRLVVAEGTGRFGLAHETAFPRPEWREMAARTGVELYNLDAGPHTTFCFADGRLQDDLPVADILLEADVLITVPCLKTHITTDYTVSLKNGYAHIPQMRRTEIHRVYGVEHALVDINRARKPDVIIVDGYDGAEGIAGGNKFDRPAGMRLMMAGTDPVAVDVISRQLMKLTYRTRYLEWAIADGLGIGDPQQIEVRGEAVEALGRRFQTPAEEVCELMPGLQFIDHDACSGCRVAALSALQRHLSHGVTRPVRIIVGGGGEIPTSDDPTIVVGDCARRHAQLGIYVPGCPASADTVRGILEDRDLVCLKCRRLVERLIDQMPPILAPYLRLVAAGSQVYLGERVSGPWHVELLVGDCSANYADRVAERSSQMGMDAERDIIKLPGCPASEEAVLAAFAQLAQVVKEQTGAGSGVSE